MNSSNRIQKITGWLVFAIAMTVYFISAERTGSLWDCGEFILGAYKLEVVHPPGAPLFMLIGRLFTWVATLVSDNPEDIAFSINLLSGLSTAFAAMFISHITIMFGKLTLVGRDGSLDEAQTFATAGAGLVGGLATAFATSIWFSAVEGEVYAMSTFFTTLTFWSMMKWYTLPDNIQTDRWLIFTVYAAGLSIGVHLLSLLTFPALALLYYFKKYKEHNFKGIVIAAGLGTVAMSFVQRVIVAGIPALWKSMELFTVNGLGLPFHSGLIPTLLLIGAVTIGGLYYAHKYNNKIIQYLFVCGVLLVTSSATIGIIVIRANAETPVNMNKPSDAMRLLPYLNREQYGDRSLLRGPQFTAKPTGTDVTDRYGREGDEYAFTEYKIALEYNNRDKVFFPRMWDNSQSRPSLYKQWMGLDPNKGLPAGRPNAGDNIAFFAQYQIGWMYWRYFMWNFSGRQNGAQGYYPWDKSSGHWITGIKPIDAIRLGNQSDLPEAMKNDQGRNVYYALPFLFGLLGLFFHFAKRKNDALALMGLFIITGIGIIIYSNQPPNEPRERDYVLAGSIFTYCIWIGLGVLSVFEFLRNKMKNKGIVPAVVATLLVLSAPILMGFQNFDDHNRSEHKGSRDYASNFLNSCEENAIIFTYGDNDTYPLWYAQEVEGIRTDVRVVNLSLIAVDWYIDLLRRKVNDSPPIKMTIPREALKGKKRNQVFYYNPEGTEDRPLPIQSVLKFIGEDHPLPTQSGRTIESYYPTKKLYIPVDAEAAIKSGAIARGDSNIVRNIPIQLTGGQLIKDEIAILDIISSNLWERPVYFAVTCQRSKLFGLEDYMQLEGLGLRIVPQKNPSDLQNYGIVGSGKVHTEKLFDNVMNKFEWGNFDKERLFVDRSYQPSVQTMQLSIRRAAYQLLRENNNANAIELTDKFFEAFPNMNFAYDYRTWPMIGVYLQSNAYDKAKPHIETLAKNTADNLEYYLSLSEEIIESSYRSETMLSYNTMESIVQEVSRRNDPAFLKQIQDLFAPYLVQESIKD
jgi:hypothetical protein